MMSIKGEHMNKMQKLLEEIEDYGKYKGHLSFGDTEFDNWVPVKEVKNIIKRHFPIEEEWIRLPESDWKHLIEQINVVVANDFIVYEGDVEYVISNICFLDGCEEFRFDAECRYFYSDGDYWECDKHEECGVGNEYLPTDGCNCFIGFSFSDIGKNVFLTRTEGTLAEMEK